MDVPISENSANDISAKNKYIISYILFFKYIYWIKIIV